MEIFGKIYPIKVNFKEVPYSSDVYCSRFVFFVFFAPISPNWKNYISSQRVYFRNRIRKNKKGVVTSDQIFGPYIRISFLAGIDWWYASDSYESDSRGPVLRLYNQLEMLLVISIPKFSMTTGEKSDWCKKANNPWKYKSQKKKTFPNKQKGKKKENKEKETKE